jgi:DUF4097 and DUF4098 domain-containing protein YvlB
MKFVHLNSKGKPAMKASLVIRLVSVVLVLFATVPAGVSARVEVKDVQVFDTGRQPRLSLKNINGNLTVEGWDKDRIEVTIVKTASSQELMEKIRVEARMDDNYLRIVGDFEDMDDDDGRNFNSKIAKIEFALKVPHGTRIHTIELINGNVELHNIEGDVDASSVNGRVSGEKLGGDVELATVNGEVSLVASGSVDSIRLHSVNGSVTLVLPKSFDANISAGTLHGDIYGMNGLDVDEARFTGSSMQGKIGKGGLKVDLNTVNGSIEIRREGEGGTREKE